MKKINKRLANAIVLGLVLSSAFAGNAWAENKISAIDEIKNIPLRVGETITLDETGNTRARGVYAHSISDSTELTIVGAGDVDINVSSVKSIVDGINADTHNSNTTGTRSKIFVDTDNDVNINVSTTSSNGVSGILTGGGDVIIGENSNINKVTIEAKANNSMGLQVGGETHKSKVSVTSGENEIISDYEGIRSYTRYAEAMVKANYDANKENSGNNIITVTGNSSLQTKGLFATNGGKIKLDADKDNTIDVKNGWGILATRMRVVDESLYDHLPETEIKLIGVNNTITSTNKYGYGIGSQYKTNVILNASDSNTITADSVGFYSTDEGNIKLDGANNIIDAPTAAIARTSGKITIKSTGNAQVTGNVTAATNGQITANFESDKSFLNGIVTTSKDDTSPDTMTDLTFANNATWNMKNGESGIGTSNVTNLTLNGGIVNMMADGVGGTKLTVENLKGSGGTFNMDLVYLDNEVDTYIASDKSDFVTVTGSAEGTQKLYFEKNADNIDAMDADEVGDKLYFARIAGSQATSFFGSDTITAVNAEDVYNHVYEIDSEEKDGNTDFFITNKDKPQPVDPDDPTPDPEPDQPGTNVDVTRGTMLADYALGTEMDRLNKRLGESRYLEDEKGLYVRYRHNHVGYDNAFKTKGNMFQLGYDKQRIEKDGTHYRGGAFDYTHGTTSFNNAPGHGEHDRYGVSLYDTWIGNKGHYYDLVIRGGQLRSDFDVYNEVDQKINSNYHRNFASISGEYGRKLDGQKGWYFEPQAQFQLARIGSADYTTNHGVRVEQDGATSAIARGGFRLGRQTFDADGNKANNYYFKADVMHEFAGKQSFTVTGKDGVYRETDTHDTWYDIGVGADIKLKKGRYFWADLERTFGGDYDTTWQVNGGFRWEF